MQLLKYNKCTIFGQDFFIAFRGVKRIKKLLFGRILIRNDKKTMYDVINCISQKIVAVDTWLLNSFETNGLVSYECPNTKQFEF